MNKSTNSGQGTLRESDAQGEAALLLVESLIHTLIERSVISVDDAVEIVGVAVDAAEEVKGELNGWHTNFQSSLTRLKAIRQSLSHGL